MKPDYTSPDGRIKLYRADCMDYMATLEDNAFELAVVDPPYGIGRDGGETGKNWKLYEKKQWDSEAPNKEYFLSLVRSSENQIIMGANYYPQYLKPSMGWIFWDKGQKLTMSDGELAYTSFERALRSVVINRCEINRNTVSFHPTQKPVKLYDWIYSNYAKEGDRILDTHLGSGSSAIAAHYAGLEFVGIELDEDYFDAAVARFEKETAQADMFGRGAA